MRLAGRVTLERVLGAWAIATVAGCIVVHGCTRIDPIAMPPRDARRWALEYLDAVRLGRSPDAPPQSARAYRADGPIFVIAWWRGQPLVRHVGPPSLARAVRDAARVFARDPMLTRLPGWTAATEPHVRFTISISQGQGAVALLLPLVSSLGLVPLRDGLVVELDGKRAWVTPEELRARGAYDGGVTTPIPDLTLGVDMTRLVDVLAREIGADASEVHARGSVRRFRASTIARDTYPGGDRVTERTLRAAAVEGARFLLRHQRPDGRFVYVYDVRTGTERPDVYNITRHAGSTYFLAQVDHLHGMPESRAGALAALRWLARHHLRRCGGEDRWCVEDNGRVEIGSAALATVAAAELLEGGDDVFARQLLTGLTAFLRAQQRPDGELMHEYDLARRRPVDVQYLYFSGEAAFALLAAHRAAGDRRDLEAARRLMRHLTGAGWSFLGSRYYYGEEHWTCIAAGEAGDRIPTPAALDFCRRWAGYNRALQYREGETPWRSSGAYGVGPVIVPRLTPVASRSEAFVSTYVLSRLRGIDDRELRGQVERGLGTLMRYRYAPGPTHLMADPLGARGGIPGSAVDLSVRNDFVQHAGSAMIRWADFLASERRRGRGRGRSDH